MKIAIVCAITLLLNSNTLYAAEAESVRSPQGASDVAYPGFGREKETTTNINPKGHDGVRVNLYWDPLTTFSKTQTNAINPTGYGYATTSGAMGGVQLLWAVWAPSDFEFQSGIDYVFPVDVQDAQAATGFPVTVYAQTLNIVGIKILQGGYRFYAGDFTLTPYAGLGFYYGKSSLTLTNANSGNQQDYVNYTKLLAVYTAGARLDYSFNPKKTFGAGIGFEFFVPTKLSDQLSQSGSTSSELSGYGSNLQSNMDFMTGVGVRIMGSVAGYF